MLDDFKNKINALSGFDFGNELQTIVEENKDVLPGYIRDQLAEGLGGDDKPSTIFGRSGYSPKTVAIKEQYGQGLGAVTDRITNYMSGQFHETLKTNIEGQVFETGSDVPYFGDILLYSSDALLEVNIEHRKEFAEQFTLPIIKEKFKAKTGFVIT